MYCDCVALKLFFFLVFWNTETCCIWQIDIYLGCMWQKSLSSTRLIQFFLIRLSLLSRWEWELVWSRWSVTHANSIRQGSSKKHAAKVWSESMGTDGLWSQSSEDSGPIRPVAFRHEPQQQKPAVTLGMQLSGSEQTWVNMKRKEKAQEYGLVAGCFFIGWLWALPAQPPFLLLLWAQTHLLHNWRKCEMFRISCCNETAGWMKESCVGRCMVVVVVGAQPVSGRITQSGDEAGGPVSTTWAGRTKSVFLCVICRVERAHIECRCAGRNSDVGGFIRSERWKLGALMKSKDVCYYGFCVHWSVTFV